MRDSLFAILVVLLVVVGLAALYEHPPGGGTAATSEPIQQPAAIRPASTNPPQPSTTQADAPPLGGLAIPAPPLAAAGSGASGDAQKNASQVPHAAPPLPARSSTLAAAPRTPVPAAMAGVMQHAAMQETSSAGDAGVGQKVFRKCAACHSLEPGRNMIGPSLGGVIGRKAGTEAGFTYSSAMKQANITWTPETLAPYLADPRRLSRETACRSRDSNRRMTATI